MRKLETHLIDSLPISGNIVDFRVFDGLYFSKLLKLSNEHNKVCYGIDTFIGLPEPDAIDLKHPNHNEIRKGQYRFEKEMTIKNIHRTGMSNYKLLKTNNYDDLETILPLDEKFCFAIIDLKQHKSTKKCLKYIWDKISYGGTLYVAVYDENLTHSSNVAITEFLKEKHLEINVSRQMIVDGAKEKFIAIKCYPSKSKPENWKDIHPKNEKVTIALVLRTGGEIYNHNYVNVLAKSIKNNVTIPHEIVCLTDDSTNFSKDIDRVIKFSHNWPTWWGKIELFKPNQFTTESVFYMDLDTIVVDNIDKIISYDGIFSGLRDFYALHSLGSGIMAFKPKHCEKIYNEFIKRSDYIIRNYKEGDQKWIDENKPSIEYIQDIYPNQIVSFKRHCLNGNDVNIPSSAKIICFHGNPRPHTVKNEKIAKYWII